MRFIAYSDLHIHPYTQFDKDGSRLSDCFFVLDLVEKLAAKAKADYALFCGDLVDQHKAVPNEVMIKLAERFARPVDALSHYVEHIAISGNHDLAKKSLYNGPDFCSALSVLEAFSQYMEPRRFRLIDNKTHTLTRQDGQDVCIYGVPYYEHPEHTYKRIAEERDQLDKNQFNILLCHITASGFDGIPGVVDPMHSCFDGYDLILCGDIHRQRYLRENMIMLGNPLPKDFSDEGSEKGIWVFDLVLDGSKRFTAKFVPTTSHFPQFTTVPYEEAETLEDTEGDAVPAFARVAPPPVVDRQDVVLEADEVSNPTKVVTKYSEAVLGDREDYEELLNTGLGLI